MRQPYLFLVPNTVGQLLTDKVACGGYKYYLGSKVVYGYSPIDNSVRQLIQPVLSSLEGYKMPQVLLVDCLTELSKILVGGVLTEREHKTSLSKNISSLIRPLHFYLSNFKTFSPEAKLMLRQNAPLTFSNKTIIF